jgi:hypothetical protein
MLNDFMKPVSFWTVIIVIRFTLVIIASRHKAARQATGGGAADLDIFGPHEYDALQSVDQTTAFNLRREPGE